MNPALSIYLKVLNEAVAADGPAIAAIISHRVRCSEALASHPTIQVGEYVSLGVTQYDVGALGLINGLAEAECGRRIAAQYDDGKLIGFVEYQKT